MNRRATLLALTAAGILPLAGPDPVRADIEVRRDAGESVFVSRPDRKPGAEATARGRTPTRVAVPGDMERLIAEVSGRYGMDPGLIATVISVESGFNHLAVSPKGARGLMQLMPATARDYGVRDLHDARENIEGGVAYLRDLLRRYNGDLKLALAAYNAGPEAVERASGVPNYRETRDYLKRIESRYGQGLGGVGAGPGTTRLGGTIQAMRDAEGNIVATNVGGRRVRVVAKRGRTPSR